MESFRPHEGFGEARKIAERLRRISGGALLDVATGDGDFIQVMMATLKDWETVTGIDRSPKEIAKAKHRLGTRPNVRLFQMNAEALEFQDEAFDTVCTANSLHHLQNVEPALTEMTRVLKSNGVFIVQEMYSDGNQTDAQQTDVLQHSWNAQIDTLLGEPQRRTFPQNTIRSMITQLGLRKLDVFNSRYYVKCLSCPDVNQCIDPTREQGIHTALQELERDLQRIQEHPEFPRLRESALHIQERINKYGVAPASILFFIGRK
jgi:ubiquinone/menaquinone biosynthesis C-methylase UbiE